jgi:glycosyltransferase involved in cell wall biosynthesis
MNRVLMTTDAVGGVWAYTVELARALEGHGIEVAVGVMGPPPTDAQRAEIGMLTNTWLFHAPYALEWMDDPWADVDAASDWLLGLAEDFSPDVIHLNGYAHAALPWRCPVVVAAHSCVLTWWRAVHQKAAPRRYAGYRRRARAGLEAADAVITPTHAFRESLEREYSLRLRGETILNARTAHAFKRGEKENVIFSAGRLWDEAKNIALLDRIAPRLEWPVQIAGDGRVQRAHHLGKLSPDRVAEHISRAAIYAAPARYEPFGLSILEAALSGCALVLSDLPTLRELWDGCALFLSPDDDAAWIATLNNLTRDSRAQGRLGTLALRRARHFTPERQAAAFLDVYRGLTSPVFSAQLVST